MEHFPIFLDLKGRRVVIVGGGAEAARKVKLLLRAGAAPLVVARAPDPLTQRAIDAGACEHHAGPFAPACLDGAALVIASTGGASPTLAQIVRARIEAALPQRLGTLARLLASLRPLVRRAVPDFDERRQFWRDLLGWGGAGFAAPVPARALAGDEAGARRAFIRALAERERRQPVRDVA